MRIAAGVVERFNLIKFFIGCYLPLTDSLAYTISLNLSLHFLVVPHFSLPFSLSYYILRFFRIFGDDSFVWIRFAFRNRYSSRSYVSRLCYPSFNLLFSPILSIFIHHLALFHFRRQFRKFCGILSLGVSNWPCFRLYMFHASHINVIWSLHRHSVSNLSLVQRTPTQLSRKEIYCCFCCASVKTPHASLTFDTRTASGCSFIRALIANSLLRLRCLVLVSSSVTSLFLRLRTGSCQVISGILLQFGFSSLPMAFSSLLRSSMNSR